MFPKGSSRAPCPAGSRDSRETQGPDSGDLEWSRRNIFNTFYHFCPQVCAQTNERNLTHILLVDLSKLKLKGDPELAGFVLVLFFAILYLTLN